MTGRILRCPALIAALAILAGCYETDIPLTRDGEGDEVSGLAGAYTMDSVGDIHIEDRSRNPQSNGYSYALLPEGGGEENGLLADKLEDGLWLAQLSQRAADGAVTYMFLFLARQSGGFAFRTAKLTDEGGAAKKLAARYKVEFGPEKPGEFGGAQLKLRGSRENMLAFLRAHPGVVPFSDPLLLVRK